MEDSEFEISCGMTAPSYVPDPATNQMGMSLSGARQSDVAFSVDAYERYRLICVDETIGSEVA